MKNTTYDLFYLKELAKSLGGDCLSDKYTNLSDKYQWICSVGHKWSSKAQNVKSLGRWCRVCGRIKSDLSRRKYKIGDLIEYAENKGGKCLSETYHGVDKIYLWRCAEGHEWPTSFHKIKNSETWCPKCANIRNGEIRTKYSIDDLKTYAINKKGLCLSEKFINIKSVYEWQCSEGHKWPATFDNILNNKRWCPDCAKNHIGNINEMNDIAKSRGGKCLSIKYINSKTKLKWECAEGHTWPAIPSLIKRGAWCPKCSQGIGERICREFFEQIFDNSFEKARPNWLKTKDGNWMELDGYSEILKIAFEHQGEQHYKKIMHFYSDEPDKFHLTLNRDKLKVELCLENGVKLIQVPSILDNIGIENVKDFLKNEFIKNSIQIPKGFNEKEINLAQIYCPNKLNELRKIAEAKDGKLLSTHYHGIFEPLEWECKNGHKWEAAPNNIKNADSWCPNCYGRNQTIEDMQILASKFEGTCLSDKYLNNSTHLLWQCKFGHQFPAKPSNVTTGYWCPDCGKLKSSLSRRKYYIEDMQRIAISKNGKCLSTEYLGYKKKLKWECENGHTWDVSPELVLRNNIWCKKCKTEKVPT